jgi:PAS domain S-box-containing protein
MNDDAAGEHGAESGASGAAGPGLGARRPDPGAIGSPGVGTSGESDPVGAAGRAREAQERDAARKRGEARQRERQHAREAARAAARAAEGVAAEAPPWHGVERRARRAAERAFPALSENVRDYAVFLLDADGIITYWGEGARLMKWWTPDEALGAHLRMLYPDGGAEDGTAEDHVAAAERTGESVSEGRRVRSDGSTFWAGVTLTALREADGTLLGFAKVTRDLTARRAADAALVAAAEAHRGRAAAEAVSAAKSEFAATMSHEVRTPITAVLGYADLLADGIAGPLTDEQRGYVERLRLSARHLHGLVEDVLALSRIDADHAPVAPAVGRVGEVVAAALALVEPQARQRGVELAEDLRTQAVGLSYWGDEARVRQILANLLANAVKFVEPRNGSPGRVTVSAGAATQPAADVHLPGAGPWVYVRVEDTGVGIPESQRAEIFEPFVQVGRRHDAPASGAGLGLTISRRLARRMGGEISVESTVGVGSAFVVWLPVAPLESLRTGGGA